MEEGTRPSFFGWSSNAHRDERELWLSLMHERKMWLGLLTHEVPFALDRKHWEGCGFFVSDASLGSGERLLKNKAEAVSKVGKEKAAILIWGFSEYMAHGEDLAYQQLCADITWEFNDCSKQVLEMESLFLMPDISRGDLACLLKDVQAEEKQKLHLTAKIQILKKAGRPSERLVSHDHCRFGDTAKHECRHVREITEEDGTEDAEADAEYDSSLKEAIRGVQDAVTRINEHLEEVRYEIEALSPTSFCGSVI